LLSPTLPVLVHVGDLDLQLPGQLEEGGWPADPEVTGSVFLRTRPLPPANGSRAKSDL
uniref:Uncharacterized protein n=1 Tax=Leptobrachium leishanense TaxID=445787 RepID=A0A8C5PPA6_9ANUR